MAKLPEKTRQIAQVHAQLINSVVMACHNPSIVSQLQPVLKSAEQNGWIELIKRIRKILHGSRDSQLLLGLDEEDAAIVLAILVGLQDASQLPDMKNSSDSKFAAPGLAKMIHAAIMGDTNALFTLSGMAQQMVNSDGDMRLLGAKIKAIIDGERDLEKLTDKMTDKGIELVESLLKELQQLSTESS